jgi:hypothetical protein
MDGMTTWREEQRQDRLVRAQIEREQQAAASQLRITEAQASAKLQREQAQARTASRQQARKARATRRAARTAWLRAHTIDALFVPVIVVPAVLAWTAMATYGRQIYGPAGVSLPAFSEGAMWAFAAARTITLRRYPERPVWHLLAGMVGFAGVGAGLNFAHAVTRVHGGPPPAGPIVGTVYAVVSVAGVTVHQLVTAGPRRSRAEREAAKPAQATAPACPWPRPAPVLAPVPDAVPEGAERQRTGTSARAQVTRQVTSRKRAQVTPRRGSQVTARYVSDADLTARLRSLVAADPQVSIKSAAASVGAGRDRVRPLLEKVRAEGREQDGRRLHVAGE